MFQENNSQERTLHIKHVHYTSRMYTTHQECTLHIKHVHYTSSMYTTHQECCMKKNMVSIRLL